MWDRATRDALIKKTAPKRKVSEAQSRAPKSTYLLSGRAYCGNCSRALYIYGRKGQNNSYGCDGRALGVIASKDCAPAPNMSVPKLNKIVTEWFLGKYGSGHLMKHQYDPGTGYAVRIAELEADRKGLRDDRSAGLYDSEGDAEWYRREYARMGREIAELKKLPERPAGMRMVPTGKTVADEWTLPTTTRPVASF